MASKFVVLALFVAVAHGSGVSSSRWSYGVSDPHTGDVKSQQENRVGDSVVGQYSLLESDGTRRVVDYAAGPHTGFNAVVRKDPAIIGAHGYAAAPVVAAAPAIASSYINPVASLGYGYSAGAAPLGYGALSYNRYADARLAGYGAGYGAGYYGAGYGSGYNGAGYGAGYGLGYGRLGW